MAWENGHAGEGDGCFRAVGQGWPPGSHGWRPRKQLSPSRQSGRSLSDVLMNSADAEVGRIICLQKNDQRPYL